MSVSFSVNVVESTSYATTYIIRKWLMPMLTIVITARGATSLKRHKLNRITVFNSLPDSESFRLQISPHIYFLHLCHFGLRNLHPEP